MSAINKVFLLLTVGTALLAMLTGCTLSGSSPYEAVAEFTEVRLVIEHNATDGDAELVVFVKGGDEGVSELRIYNPDGSVVFDLSTQESTVGLRVFQIESAEPGVAGVLRSYPEGSYRIEGVTIGGARLQSSAYLSHKLPAAAKLEVNNIAGTVTWSSTEDAVKYSIELEREVNGEDEMKLTAELPTSSRLFAIPVEFLLPGNYQVGIAVHSLNGNIVVVEQEFTREKQAD